MNMSLTLMLIFFALMLLEQVCILLYCWYPYRSGISIYSVRANEERIRDIVLEDRITHITSETRIAYIIDSSGHVYVRNNIKLSGVFISNGISSFSAIIRTNDPYTLRIRLGAFTVMFVSMLIYTTIESTAHILLPIAFGLLACAAVIYEYVDFKRELLNRFVAPASSGE